MASVIVKKASYDYKTLKPKIFDMMGVLEDGLISSKSRVLIKPNFLLPSEPERGILTHPLVVKATAEYVLEKGGYPRISDSPASGSFRKIIKTGGYDRALEGLDVELTEFNRSEKVDIGKPFGKIDIAKDVIDADVVINLAKLKTHTQMLLTLGVKNLFGCIVGLRKPEWHYRTGIDRGMFAKLLVQIYKAVNPAVTIVDGILAMEGQGPGKRGRPRRLNVLVGSKDAVYADAAICRMLKMDPQKLPTIEAAKELGFFCDDIYIKGDFNFISDFRFPEPGSLTFGPKYLGGIMRRYLTQRPAADNCLCKLCGECWKYCPAKAITWNWKKIFVDYDRCIRCYCCIEICPHGALRAKEPLLGRVFRKMFKMK